MFKSTVFVFTLLALTTKAQNLTAIEEELIKETFKGQQLAQENAQKIWPGYDISQMPIIRWTKEKAFLFNYTSPSLPDGFEPLEGYNEIAVKNNPNYKKGFSLNVPMGEEKVCIFESRLNFRIVFHECFHAFQKQHHFYRKRMTSVSKSTPLDFALADLEQRYLARALKAKSKTDRLEHLRWFLSIRTYRNEGLDDRQVDAQNSLEANEGTARYADSKIGALMMEESPEKQIDVLVKNLNRKIRIQRFSRGRYYATGNAMALLLDQMEVTYWKQKMEKGAIFTEELAKLALPIERPELLDLMDEEGFKSKVAFYEASFAEEEERIRNLEASFYDSEGVEITLYIPHPVRPGFGGRIERLPNGRLHISGRNKYWNVEKPGVNVRVSETLISSLDSRSRKVEFFLTDFKVLLDEKVLDDSSIESVDAVGHLKLQSEQTSISLDQGSIKMSEGNLIITALD